MTEGVGGCYFIIFYEMKYPLIVPEPSFYMPEDPGFPVSDFRWGLGVDSHPTTRLFK